MIWNNYLLKIVKKLKNPTVQMSKMKIQIIITIMQQILFSVIRHETPLTTEWWNFMIEQGLTTITVDDMKDHMLSVEEIDHVLNVLPLNWRPVIKTELTNLEKELVYKAYFTLKFGFERLEKELRNNSTQILKEFISSKINYSLHREVMLSLNTTSLTLKRLKTLEKDIWNTEYNDPLLKLICDIFGFAPIIKQLNQYVKSFSPYDYVFMSNIKLGHDTDVKLTSLSSINFRCMTRTFRIEVV